MFTKNWSLKNIVSIFYTLYNILTYISSNMIRTALLYLKLFGNSRTLGTKRRHDIGSNIVAAYSMENPPLTVL